MLNSAAQHSVTYDASNDSLTANLPTSTPIERVPNKQKMMILIYFVQRDFERRKAPRKIDSEISLELRIVERIIGQFSNHAQGLRTLKEYTKVGDHVDTSVGMERNRTAPDENGKGTKSIQMTITKEVRDVIMEWLQDMLAPAVILLCEVVDHCRMTGNDLRDNQENQMVLRREEPVNLLTFLLQRQK